LVEVENTNKINRILFDEEITRYFEMLKEHIDYVPEKYITKEIWNGRFRSHVIGISKDYFKL